MYVLIPVHTRHSQDCSNRLIFENLYWKQFWGDLSGFLLFRGHINLLFLLHFPSNHMLVDSQWRFEQNFARILFRGNRCNPFQPTFFLFLFLFCFVFVFLVGAGGGRGRRLLRPRIQVMVMKYGGLILHSKLFPSFIAYSVNLDPPFLDFSSSPKPPKSRSNWSKNYFNQ